MRRLLIAAAVASLLPALAHAGSGIDPCVNAWEKFGDMRKTFASQVQTQRAAIDQAVPPPLFEKLWFAAQEPYARKYFDTNLAPTIRAGKGDVNAAIVAIFANWRKDAKVRAEMTAQFRTALRTLHDEGVATGNASLTAVQQDMHASCPMDAGNQAVRVVIGAVTLPVTVISGNIDGVKRERGVAAQALRLLGPSARNIQQHGIFGGECSIFRRPLGC